MKTHLENPFLPYVSRKELLAFRPNESETYTKSPLINAVMEAMFMVRPLNGANVARYLRLPYTDMRGAFRCITGLCFQDFHAEWTLHRIWDVINSDPNLTTNEIAHCSGFANRASLWKFLHKHHLVKEPHNGDYEPANSILQLWREDKKL